MDDGPADAAWALLHKAVDGGDVAAVPDAIERFDAALAGAPGHEDEPWWRYGRGVAHACLATEHDDLDAWMAAAADLHWSWLRPHPHVDRSGLAADLATALAQLVTGQSERDMVDGIVAELDLLSEQVEDPDPVVDMMRGVAHVHRFATFGVELDADVEVGLALLERSLPALPDHTPLLDLALLCFATTSGAAHRVEGAVAGLGRLRELLDPDDERRPGLDEIESDLLYAVWTETDDPAVEAAALDALEHLCATADDPPPTAPLRCGEMRAYRVFCAEPGTDTGADLAAAVGWLEAAADVVAEDDLAIDRLLLGMCLWRRFARERDDADKHRAASCLDEALLLGLADPKHVVTAHSERLTVSAEGLVADSPTADDIAVADTAFREALTAQAAHTDMDLGRRAELAMGLARVEMLLMARRMDELDVDRVRRNLDLAGRRPDPPDGWSMTLSALRGGLQVFDDGTGLTTGDAGLASLVEALGQAHDADATDRLRRMIGYASVVAGGRFGGLHAFASAEAVLRRPDAPAAERFMMAVADIYRHGQRVPADPRLPALIDAALAVAAEIPPESGDGRQLARHFLPALHAMREAVEPTGSPLPAASPVAGAGAGATATMLDHLLDQSRAMVRIAALDADPARQLEELEELERSVRGVRGAPAGGVAHGMGAAVLLTLWLRRAESRGNAADAERAIAWVADALDFVRGPESPMWTRVTGEAARSHRLRGRPEDQVRSRELGLAALHGHAWMVLLQSGTDHAVTMARQAAALAVRLARWCLADGATEDLLAALDAGRGLVLQAALTSRGVTERLHAAGETALADEWVAAGGDDRVSLGAAADLDLHTDLRRRVLLALGSGPVGLLETASRGSIRATLAAQGAAALVYLVPADDDGPGLAVVVPASEPIEVLERPDLDAGTAATLAREVAPGWAARDLGPVDRRVHPDGLPDLLDFAWRTAGQELADLADRLRGADGRPPALVLVPFGALALVPWHAARPSGSRGLGLLGHAVISYAPSAQLWDRARARPPLPGGGALVVGNPTGDLRDAGAEARSIVAAFHPDATYLGTPGDPQPGDTGPGEPVPIGPGRAAEVLARLADDTAPVTLLHLACHARADPTAPGRSSVVLADRELAVEEILALRPSAALRVDTVCLAGCSTNVAGADHDEAFSLASAFLAAGARTAYGSMWTVPDGHTSRLMFMVHHHLRSDRCSPAEALHRAQLWAADPDRVPPPTMPAALARDATGGDDPLAWAGFQHVGA